MRARVKCPLWKQVLAFLALAFVVLPIVLVGVASMLLQGLPKEEP